MKGHCWKSKKWEERMAEANRDGIQDFKWERATAIIDGKSVEYSFMTEEKEHDFNWDDQEYLGYGEYEKFIGEY